MLELVDVGTRQRDAFRNDVLDGLSQRQKTLPARWLYDERGSELFEAITQLEEYYPTRTETAILQDNAAEIAKFVGPCAVLLEYGAGAGVKTEIVLRALEKPRRYVPIDIAGSFLDHTVGRFRSRFPGIDIHPVIADFTSDFEIPASTPVENRVAFFPGSTIGNLDIVEARAFFRRIRRHVGKGGKAIIGVDLKKSLDVIVAAYDDREGVTAAFDLNILERINRELGGTFEVANFKHEARWNEPDCAIEMHLVSTKQQEVLVDDRKFHFANGETIHTESSRKYDLTSFADLARSHGWRTSMIWTDAQKRFAVFGFQVAA